MSPTLRKPRKPTDALGAPINEGVTYTPLTSHGRVVNGAPRVFNPDVHKFLGSHEAVQAAPSLWIPITAPTDAKLAARKAKQDAANVVSEPDWRHIVEPRIIPLERVCFASENFEWRGLSHRIGDRHDLDDEVVKAAPQWFRMADRSPLPKQFAPEAA